MFLFQAESSAINPICRRGSASWLGAAAVTSCCCLSGVAEAVASKASHGWCSEGASGDEKRSLRVARVLLWGLCPRCFRALPSPSCLAAVLCRERCVPSPAQTLLHGATATSACSQLGDTRVGGTPMAPLLARGWLLQPSLATSLPAGLLGIFLQTQPKIVFRHMLHRGVMGQMWLALFSASCRCLFDQAHFAVLAARWVAQSGSDRAASRCCSSQPKGCGHCLGLCPAPRLLIVSEKENEGYV